MSWRRFRVGSAIAVTVAACGGPSALAERERGASVVATAYNSLPAQTFGDPTLGAWGDRLVPGIKAIAVSRDLEKLGLVRGVRVRIEGLDGEYKVLDRMAARWTSKIDIYMGVDVAAARKWGRRRVQIHWAASE